MGAPVTLVHQFGNEQLSESALSKGSRSADACEEKNAFDVGAPGRGGAAGGGGAAAGGSAARGGGAPQRRCVGTNICFVTQT